MQSLNSSMLIGTLSWVGFAFVKHAALELVRVQLAQAGSQKLLGFSFPRLASGMAPSPKTPPRTAVRARASAGSADHSLGNDSAGGSSGAGSSRSSGTGTALYCRFSFLPQCRISVSTIWYLLYQVTLITIIILP